MINIDSAQKKGSTQSKIIVKVDEIEVLRGAENVKDQYQMKDVQGPEVTRSKVYPNFSLSFWTWLKIRILTKIQNENLAPKADLVANRTNQNQYHEDVVPVAKVVLLHVKTLRMIQFKKRMIIQVKCVNTGPNGGQKVIQTMTEINARGTNDDEIIDQDQILERGKVIMNSSTIFA